MVDFVADVTVVADDAFGGAMAFPTLVVTARGLAVALTALTAAPVHRISEEAVVTNLATLARRVILTRFIANALTTLEKR